MAVIERFDSYPKHAHTPNGSLESELRTGGLVCSAGFTLVTGF